MGANSKIEWTHHTFNPWQGCTKVHEGCTHCYAESLSKRTGRVKWGPNGTRVKTSEAYWRQPLKWNREAEAAGERRRVFCASLADVFEDWSGPVLDHRGRRLYESPGNPSRLLADDEYNDEYGDRWITLDDLRRDLFALIDQTPWLDWLLLTKRPENVRRMWPGVRQSQTQGYFDVIRGRETEVYRPNVWLGTSISNQETANEFGTRLNELADLCPVRFLSIEPLLGPIVLPPQCLWAGSGVQWIIVGGESGPGARPMHPDWARSIRDQSQAAGVPFFFKQWGEWAPYSIGDDPGRCPTLWIAADGSHRKVGPMESSDAILWRPGKSAAGRLLDGREWSEFPAVPTGSPSEV